MIKLKIGERVGAISHADDDNVYFFGYGTYQGEEVPPPEVKFMGMTMRNANPKIVLDNGKVVWGCECWWGPEERINRQLEFGDDNKKKTIVLVDIEKARLDVEEARVLEECEEDE